MAYYILSRFQVYIFTPFTSNCNGSFMCHPITGLSLDQEMSDCQPLRALSYCFCTPTILDVINISQSLEMWTILKPSARFKAVRTVLKPSGPFQSHPDGFEAVGAKICRFNAGRLCNRPCTVRVRIPYTRES